MQIFSRTILNYGTTFLSVKALVAQANTNPPPSAPTLLSPANGAVNVTIPTTLSWNASSGATSYTLQVSTNSNFTSFVYNESGITGTSQQVTGLNTSTQYYWRVRALNSFGSSNWSTVRSFTTISALPTQGLVAYYTFNSNFNDLSGNQFHGTPINNPTFGNDRFNRTNSAIYLNGTNQYISLPNTINITYDITISFWIKTNLIDNGSWPFGTFIIDRDICGVSSDWSIGLGLGGKIQFNTGLNNNDNVLTSLIDVNDNNWKHIVVIRDAINGTKKIYINGILDASTNFETQAFTNNSINIFIGASFCDTFNHKFYRGLIDDLRIYNRILTEPEIQQLYNEN